MIGPVSILSHRDVSYLDSLLLDQGSLRMVDTSVLAAVPYDDLRYWCNRRAVYGLVTTELVAWLKARIGGRIAIEVGSGNGALGRALGIPRTDSRIQETPEMRSWYARQGQAVVTYGDDVEHLDAIAAVRRYRPKVVVGMWVTEYVSPHETPGPGGGSVFGIEEQKLFDEGVETYIVVGNMTVHGHKRILREPPSGVTVEGFSVPWIWSRSATPSQNCVLVWDKTVGLRDAGRDRR